MKLVKHLLILVILGSLVSCANYSEYEDDSDGPGRKANGCKSSTWPCSKVSTGTTKVNTAASVNANTTNTNSNGFELHHRAQLNSQVKGIYISQKTMENREYLQYVIERSKQAGINSFIIDLNVVSNAYEKNILLVRNSGIRFVARVVIFPFGANRQNVSSEAYWMSRYRLVDAAIRLGADEIQLDYVRYAANNEPLVQNAQEVHAVIGWFKNKIGDRAKLQIDVFGESNFKESLHLGQHLPSLGQTVDAVCPMIYPSHFEPYQEHVRRPYDIIYAALASIKENYNGNTPFQLYPYIELSNDRHHLTEEQLQGYIHCQIKAVEDAKADGWYAWSAGNKYDHLFALLTEPQPL